MERSAAEKRGLMGAVKYTAHAVAACCGLPRPGTKSSKTPSSSDSGYHDVAGSTRLPSPKPASAPSPGPIRIHGSPHRTSSHANSSPIRDEKLHSSPVTSPGRSRVTSPSRNPEKQQAPASPDSSGSLSPGWTPPPGHFDNRPAAAASLSKVKTFSPGASTSGTKPVMYGESQVGLFEASLNFQLTKTVVPAGKIVQASPHRPRPNDDVQNLLNAHSYHWDPYSRINPKFM